MNLLSGTRGSISAGIFNYTEGYEKKNKSTGRRGGKRKDPKKLADEMKKRMAILDKIKVEESEELEQEVSELAILERQIKSIR